jgi:hypothetical protein
MFDSVLMTAIKREFLMRVIPLSRDAVGKDSHA